MPLSLRIKILALSFFVLSQLSAQQNNSVEFAKTLMEAQRLLDAKQWPQAAPLWLTLTEKNPVNGEYWRKLGLCYYNNKEYTKSIEAYKKTLELREGILYSVAYNIACDYALNNETEPALDWLEKAFNMGFTTYSKAVADDDLKSLRANPRFTRILGLEDVSKMTRTQAWHYDMELLKKEVQRKVYIRRDLSLDEFNKQYEIVYNTIDKKTDVQIVLDLIKLVVMLKDGHTLLYPGGLIVSKSELLMTLPLQFYIFKEGLYIIAAAPQYKNLVGCKVLGFDAQSADEIITALKPLINRDNDMGILENVTSLMRFPAALNGLGLIPDQAKTKLKLEDINGKEVTALVEANMLAPTVNQKMIPANWITIQQTTGLPIPMYLKDLGSAYWFEELPDIKTVYMQFNSVQNDPKENVIQFTDRLFDYIKEHKDKKLIIDLRWNEGGNTKLLPYFINSVMKNEQVNRKGNLYVITGRRTFSAAQNFSTYLEKRTMATFVGEPTGSSPNFVGEGGPTTFITLPYSKLNLNISYLYWQSSWPDDSRTWIAPTIYTPPTFTAYRANRDESMEAIISLIKAFP